MKRAIVVGSASCLFRDLKAIEKLVERDTFAEIIGVNRAAMVVPVHRWASLHPELFFRDRGGAGWLEERREFFPEATPVLYGPSSKPRADVVPIETAGRGSSGYFGVELALELGAERILLVGIPMTPTPHVLESEPWDAANAHFKVWQEPETLERFRNVRSVSGRTAELLGTPSREWWRGLTNGDARA